MPSTRAEILTRRTYCRPKGNSFETWEDVVARVTEHQEWLWTRAKDDALNTSEKEELEDLRVLMLDRKVLPSGRILWMGGTDQAERTEIAMFNCCFLEVRDVYTAVDAYYLLLNGCGVGFKPVAGLLNGFSKPVEVEVIRSERRSKGSPSNHEQFYDQAFGPSYKRVWHLTIGDSGRAWAKALGKILAMKKPVDKIILD